MPALIAIIYYFCCSSNQTPQAEEEMLMLVTLRSRAGHLLSLKRAPNQNTTCEKENQHSEGQGKVPAMTSHDQGYDLLMVWKLGNGQGHLRPKRLLRTDQKKGEKRLCMLLARKRHGIFATLRA